MKFYLLGCLTLFSFVLTQAQTIIVIDAAGMSHNDISGVIVDNYAGIDISNCSSIQFSIDYNFSLVWDPDGSNSGPDMESNTACNFGLGCPGDPTNPTEDDCGNCWDFMWMQFYIDGGVVDENLIGVVPNISQSGTYLSPIFCPDGANDAEINITNQNWAAAETNEFSNVSILCWEAVPMVDLGPPICGGMQNLPGTINDPAAAASFNWTSDGSASIDNPSAQSTFADNADDGEKFTLTVTDVNGCDASSCDVAIVNGGFTADLTGGGELCEGQCTSGSSNFNLEINGGTPDYIVGFSVNGLNIPGSPPVSGDQEYVICADPDAPFPGSIDTGTDPWTINIDPGVFALLGDEIELNINTITDDTGCTGTVSGGPITFTLVQPPEINAPTEANFCVGSDFIMDLTTLNDQINDGSGDDVLFFFDEDLTNPIDDPSMFQPGTANSIWVVVDDGTCFSEAQQIGLSFDLQPEMNIISNIITGCGDNPFDLPPVSDYVNVVNGTGSYYLDAEGNDGPINFIDPTMVSTIFVYGGIEDCDAAVQLNVAVSPNPIINAPGDELGGCGSLQLPEITGDFIVSTLYNTSEDGTGTEYLPGDMISDADMITQLYAIATGMNGCITSQEVNIALGSQVNFSAAIPPTSCDSLRLPPISGSPGAIYIDALGMTFSAGQVLMAPFTGPLFIEDPSLDPSCAPRVQINFEITESPNIILPADTLGCGDFALPDFRGTFSTGAHYSTEPFTDTFNFLNPGEILMGAQKIYVLDTIGNCSFLDSFNLMIQPTPFVGIDSTINICMGFNFETFDLMSAIQNPVETGVWSYPNVPDFDPQDSTNVDFSPLPVGINDLVYLIEDNCGIYDAHVFVDVIEPPFAGIDTLLEICSAPIPYNFMALVGNPEVGGQWVQASGPTISLLDTTSVDLSSAAPGMYSFVYTIEGDSNNLFCNGESSSIRINFQGGPNAGIDNSLTACLGDIVDLNSLLDSNAETGGMFEASGIFFTPSGEWNTSMSTPNQNYEILYILESMTPGCPSDTASFDILLTENLTAGNAVLDIDDVCPGGSVNLEDYIEDFSQGGSFVLTSDYTTPADGTQGFNTNTAISYLVEGSGGCDSDTTDFEVLVGLNESIDIDLNGNTICDNNCIELILNSTVGTDADFNFIVTDTTFTVTVFPVMVALTANTPVSIAICIGPDDFGLTMAQDTIYVGPTPATYEVSEVFNLTPDGCTIDANFNQSEFNYAGTSSELLELELCTGQSVEIDGTDVFESTEIMLTSSTGCDSLLTVVINNFPEASETISGTFCDGTTINVFGTEISTDTNDSFMGTSTIGCDSIVTVDVTFQDFASSFVNPELCPGQSVIVEGVTFDEATPSGEITLMDGSVAGCDSIIFIDLTFSDILVENVNLELCPGQNYIVENDIFDENNPMGSVDLTSVSGCDSTVNVMLTFSSAIVFNLDDELCEGEFVIVGNQTFDENMPSGSVDLVSASGCDSTVIVNLEFNDVITESIQLELCPGQTYVVDGTIFDENTPTGNVQLTTASGCDSIVDVDLTFSAMLSGNANIDLCPGEEFNIGNMVFDENLTSGSVTLTSSGGCDSLVTVNLNYSDPSATVSTETACPDDTDGMITIEAVDGLMLPISVSINSGTPTEVNTLPFSTSAPIGLNEILITDINGCMVNAMETVDQIGAGAIQITSSPTGIINQFNLEVTADFPMSMINWSPEEGLSCTQCPNPTADITANTTYIVNVGSTIGCEFMEQITLDFTTPPESVEFYIPTVFSFNDQGANGTFYIQTAREQVITAMFVFDRWGNKVFNAENIITNEPDLGWDGTYDGQELEQGVYVYVVNAIGPEGPRNYTGNVTLIK